MSARPRLAGVVPMVAVCPACPEVVTRPQLVQDRLRTYGAALHLMADGRARIFWRDGQRVRRRILGPATLQACPQHRSGPPRIFSHGALDTPGRVRYDSGVIGAE